MVQRCSTGCNKPVTETLLDYDCNAVWRPRETLPLDIGQQLHGSPWQILATVVHSKHSGDMGIALWFTWFYVAWRALPWSERTTYIQSRNWATGQGFSARSAAQSKTLKPQWWSSGAASRCCYSSLHFDWANCMKYHLLFPYQIVQQVRCLSSDPNSVHQEQAFWQASGPHKHSSYNDSFCSYTINPLANCKAQQNQNIGHVIKRNWIFTIINEKLMANIYFFRHKKNCPESQLPVANNYLELQQCLAPSESPTGHTRPNDSYAILVPRELLVITVGWIPEASLQSRRLSGQLNPVICCENEAFKIKIRWSYIPLFFLDYQLSLEDVNKIRLIYIYKHQKAFILYIHFPPPFMGNLHPWGFPALRVHDIHEVRSFPHVTWREWVWLQNEVTNDEVTY